MTSTDLNERTHFKVGSRKSKLAMVQTESIIEDLKQLNPTFTFEIVNFDTIGDKILDRALAKIGDKGLFTRELEDALINRSIDFVVHSLKDMPCQTLPANLVISAVPRREDPNDAVVMSKRWEHLKDLGELPPNSLVGTSSLRRIAQLKQLYPQLRFDSIRGNLNTRFRKLDEDQLFDAIILAVAGLKRLNFSDRITYILPSTVSMHAVSQGALGIESRADDEFLINMLNQLNDEETVLRCVAERSFMTVLNGGCSAPIGVNSKVEGDKIHLDGLVLSLDGVLRCSAQFETRLDTHEPQSGSCLDAIFPTTAHLHDNSGATDHDNNNTIRSYTYIVANNVDRVKLEKAEFCGMHLGQMLLISGADALIEESRNLVKSS